MARKIVDIALLKNQVNDFLAQSTKVSPDRRQGQIDILCTVLHATGQYSGFRYLMQSKVPSGELPGIFINESGTIEGTPTEEAFAEGKVDPTRVYFF